MCVVGEQFVEEYQTAMNLLVLIGDIHMYLDDGSVFTTLDTDAVPVLSSLAFFFGCWFVLLTIIKIGN